jgi:flagellar hook assembly protein FlgD
LNCSPNPFSPDGDGHEDFTIISYELPTSAALVRIRIFDARGRLIRTLANGEPSGAHGQVVWDGLTDRREKARIGIYIVLLEALDASGGSMQATKCTVVVAARL